MIRMAVTLTEGGGFLLLKGNGKSAGRVIDESLSNNRVTYPSISS
jgi:hypothetical protein